MVRSILFGGVALLSGAVGYGVSELKTTSVDQHVETSAIIQPATLGSPTDTAVQAARVATDPAPVASLKAYAPAAKAKMSRSLAPLKNDVYAAVCETPTGECTVGPLPINSSCICGSTPGRITQ